MTSKCAWFLYADIQISKLVFMADTVMSYNNNILLADIKDLFIIQLSNWLNIKGYLDKEHEIFWYCIHKLT